MVDNGFCIIHGVIHRGTSLLRHCCSGNISILSHGCLFTGDSTPLQKYHYPGGTAYFIGQLCNKRLIRSLASHLVGSKPVTNDAQALCTLSRQLGNVVLGLAEGSFCFFTEARDGTLTLITDPDGADPVYVVNAGEKRISDRLKVIGGGDEKSTLHDCHAEPLPARPIEHQQQLTPIPAVQCLQPGTLNILRFDGQSQPCYESYLLPRPALHKPALTTQV